jgi:hypothetical protein
VPLQFTKLCQGSGKIEVLLENSSVRLDAPAQPSNRFRIFAAPQLGHTGKHHPQMGADVARTEAERFFDMIFRLYASADEVFGQADGSRRGSFCRAHIPIDGIICSSRWAAQNSISRAKWNTRIGDLIRRSAPCVRRITTPEQATGVKVRRAAQRATMRRLT